MSFAFGGKKVWVAGDRGMVGSALVRRLQREDCTILVATRAECDLTNQAATWAWMQKAHPDVIMIAAAKVGGLFANAARPAEFIYQNLMIAANIIHCAYELATTKLLFLGSSCIYPKFAAQPMHETALLSGALEPSNAAYAVAKIAGLKLCAAYREQYNTDFITVMPPNLYGINDNFDPQKSHVVAALLRKIHAAKTAGANTITIWGSGTARREFMYVDDLADACVHIMQHYSDTEHINAGSGEEITIRGLAERIAHIVGFTGTMQFDHTKPDGTPRKIMDNTKLTSLGWRPRMSLDQGLAATYAWYRQHLEA